MDYGIVPHGGLGGLAWGDTPAPTPRGSILVNDGVSHSYRFNVYDIWACPAGINAVYIFARLEGSVYVPTYVGRADILNRRLTDHDRRQEAIRHGAAFLLVHIPAPLDPISYVEAERRLIRQYAPILNERLNPLAGLLER